MKFKKIIWKNFRKLKFKKMKFQKNYLENFQEIVILENSN